MLHPGEGEGPPIVLITQPTIRKSATSRTIVTTLIATNSTARPLYHHYHRSQTSDKPMRTSTLTSAVA